jgi:hypothetical protein
MWCIFQFILRCWIFIGFFIVFFQCHPSIYGWFWIDFHDLFQFDFYKVIVVSNKYLNIWLMLDFFERLFLFE